MQGWPAIGRKASRIPRAGGPEMTLSADLAKSREHEMTLYLESMKALYDNASVQNEETYDICFDLTDGFRKLTGEAILKDSRIVKILRYAIAPSISQMKFGQFFGLTSTDAFEGDRLSEGSSAYRQLQLIADKMAEFIVRNIDRSRFIWTVDPKGSSALAYHYAKKWTCGVAADQNAQTAYRNWRKSQQEQAIIRELVKSGYTASGFRGTVMNDTDIKIGEYKSETRVQGRTVQKADVIFRHKKSKKLVLVEAKAVGVELDATKRIKECCDKAGDWATSKALGSPKVVAVIAGFFNPTQIANLSAAGVSVVWEHRISDLHGTA
jgi:hypothetical protein